MNETLQHLLYARPASLLAIAVITFGCCTDSPAGPDRVGLTPEAPAYALHGPHWVGFRRLEAPATGAAWTKVGIWYPARNPAAAVEALTYETMLSLGGFDIPAVVEGNAIADAPLAGDHGPFPLVVFSHGFALRPELYSMLVEHYASHGFVVLAPDHADGGDWIESAWQAASDRPRDIQRTLAFAEALNAPEGAFAGALDLENIALVGHSFGGYTALAMAGARIDLDGFHSRCESLAEEDAKNFVCAAFLGREADMAARAGLTGDPDGLWPAVGDSRITAIVPIAGDAYLFNEAGLSSIAIPMMAIGGTADRGTPFEWGAQLAYDAVSSERKAIVALEGADHMVTVNPCEIMPWTEGLPAEYQAYVCNDPAWDKPFALDGATTSRTRPRSSSEDALPAAAACGAAAPARQCSTRCGRTVPLSPRAAKPRLLQIRAEPAAWPEPDRVSELLREFAEPLLYADPAGPSGLDTVRTALMLAMICWNLPVYEALGNPLFAQGVRTLDAVEQQVPPVIASTPRRLQLSLGITGRYGSERPRRGFAQGSEREELGRLRANTRLRASVRTCPATMRRTSEPHRLLSRPPASRALRLRGDSQLRETQH
jgi:predicted dienelactone hydrolase